MQKRPEPPQSLKPGHDLETKTRKLLQLFPAATVSDETLLTGKKADAVCTIQSPLSPTIRIAVECKDYSRRLPRVTCALILSDYYPLLQQSAIDQFLLITRNGVVPNAQSLFDGQQTRHLTFSQLVDILFNSAPLVYNMKEQFNHGGLSKYYIAQSAAAPPLQFAAHNFSLLYNDFLDFAIDIGAPTLTVATCEWKRYNATAPPGVKYTQRTFERCIEARTVTANTSLEGYVLEWLKDSSIRVGLALLGSYGTGKSSFARRIAYVTAQRHLRDAAERIPFLIELKEFGSHQDIRGLVTHELVNRHGVANGSFELFQSLNKAGRLFLILDGFDEMKQGMTRDALQFNFSQINQLLVADAKVLLCGRPTIFDTQE